MQSRANKNRADTEKDIKCSFLSDFSLIFISDTRNDGHKPLSLTGTLEDTVYYIFLTLVIIIIL